jgi:hypothetical protein
MSTANATRLDLTTPPVIKNLQMKALIVAAVAGVIALYVAFTNPTVFFRGYLVSYMDWLGVALGSLAILMINYMTGGGWGTSVRGILMAAARCWPLMFVLFFPLAFSIKLIYPWAMPLESITDPAIHEHLEKHSFIVTDYLNARGFLIRGIIYFVVWGGMIFLFSRWSKELDQPPVRDLSARFKRLAAPGLILYAFAISFAAIDWVMSLNPSWFSTIYGLIFVAGELIAALGFTIIIERILYNYRPMSILLRPSYVHDHGKYMLAFTMVWAYFSFSQWLIIWAGNLPEEITWYFRRLHGGWQYVGLFLVVFHFFAPFFILLSRPFKRDIRSLVWLAVWMMFIRYVDLFWHIEPSFSKDFTVTLADLAVPFAMGGLFVAYFCYNLNQRPLIPAYDATAQAVLEPEHD